jgi:hypothetical protein
MEDALWNCRFFVTSGDSWAHLAAMEDALWNCRFFVASGDSWKMYLISVLHFGFPLFHAVVQFSV